MHEKKWHASKRLPIHMRTIAPAGKQTQREEKCARIKERSITWGKTSTVRAFTTLFAGFPFRFKTICLFVMRLINWTSPNTTESGRCRYLQQASLLCTITRRETDIATNQIRNRSWLVWFWKMIKTSQLRRNLFRIHDYYILTERSSESKG